MPVDLCKRPVRGTRVSELSDAMEFDYPVEVLPGGIVVEGPRDLWAPELRDGELDSDRWELLDGYSGQQGYSGPIMHASELIGGGMARDILDTPGIYVALVSHRTELDPSDVPEDHPVQPVTEWDPAEVVARATTCGECGLSWDDDVATSMTPVPGGRCPFEEYHGMAEPDGWAVARFIG